MTRVWAAKAFSLRLGKSMSLFEMIEHGVDIMVTATNQGKVKKTSRGMRKHVRRMKQETRKTGVPINELKKKVRISQVPKTKKEA